MHAEVKFGFMGFTEMFEGGRSNRIDYMFLDSLGRVGTAYGIDLDTNGSGRSPNDANTRSQGLPKALALVWVIRGTSRTASRTEVEEEWDVIKRQPTGYNYSWYKTRGKLQLTDASMTSRVYAMLALNEAALKRSPSFRDFDQWPADAQLALLGLSWNGPGHLTGNTHGTLTDPAAFRAACQAQNFTLAASLCTMVSAPTNASIFRRSAAQKDLLLNAATVVNEPTFYPRSKLYWPTVLL